MAETTNKGKTVAIVIFVLLLAVLGYFAWKKFGGRLRGSMALPTDPKIAAARAAYEAQMLDWLANGQDSEAKAWRASLGPYDKQKYLENIRYASFNSTQSYEARDAQGLLIGTYIVKDLYVA